MASSPVIHDVAEVLHFQDRGIGAAFGGFHQMRLGDLGHHHAVVSQFQHLLDQAFNRGDGYIQDRATVRAGLESEAVNLDIRSRRVSVNPEWRSTLRKIIGSTVSLASQLDLELDSSAAEL